MAVLTLTTRSSLTTIGVSFKPGGGFPFFPMPAGELHNLSVPLDAVWGRGAHEVCERLMSAPTPASKVAAMEQSLLAIACGRFDRHPAVPGCNPPSWHTSCRQLSAQAGPQSGRSSAIAPGCDRDGPPYQ